MLAEIAIIGHPNEGKSSVLSTLAEDDSVRISPYPGETTVCRSFPVMIDNHEIIRFVGILVDEEVVVHAHFSIERVRGRDPVKRAPDLAAV